MLVSYGVHLEPGDVVVLRGSDYTQKMTIESMNAGETVVKVVYFCKNNVLHKETIDTRLLGKVLE